MRKMHLIDTYLECDLRFFSFSVKKASKLKKTDKKVAKNGTKEGCMFHALCVHTGMCMTPYVINQLRRPKLTYAEGLVKF